MIAFEQLQKTRLCARGALVAEQTQVFRDKVEFFHVEQQLLHPQARPFAHRDQLGRLVMGEAQRRQRRYSRAKTERRFSTAATLRRMSCRASA